MDPQKIHKTATIAILISLLLLTTNTLTEVHAKTFFFTATIAPLEINNNQIASYTVNTTNTGDATLISTSMTIPTGFTVSSPITIVNQQLWNYTVSTTTINLTANSGGAALQQGESITFTFNAIAPATPGETTWTAQATSSIGGGTPLILQGEQPTVMVLASQFNPPTIEASHGTINQNQASTLSQQTFASGGIAPYTYQWLEAFDGGAFSAIAGADGQNYVFSPTTSTATGTWSFRLDVTDSSNTLATTTSNTVNIIVNSALEAPILTANPNPISQNQPSALTSSQVTSGTAPYTYQWFQKNPGSDYTKVGAESPNYIFPGSTTTETWAFLIQVTDYTGTSVNSTALYLTVNSTPTFSITVTQTAHGTISPGTMSVSLNSDQTFTISPDISYQIADVLVDGISVGVVTSYSFTGVTADHSITANFAIISGNSYFITVASAHGLPPPSAQVHSGGSFSVAVTNPEGDTAHRWICTGYSIDGASAVSGTSYTFDNVQASHTITFNWQEQYYLTAISPEGSIIGAGWYDKSTTASVSITTNIIPIDSGTRQVFTGWIGDATGTGTTSNPIIMDCPKTATATWKTQYQVSYATLGNTLQVNAPPTEWVDSNTMTEGTFPTSITNSAGNTKDILISDNSPITITQPTTITGTYQTQYLVTLSQNGIITGTSEAVLTVLDEAKTGQQLPSSLWINMGDSITFTYVPTIENTQTGKKYTLTSVNSTSPLTINEPTTIQAIYETQTVSSSFALNTPALAAIILAIPASVIIPLVATRRKRKKKITPIASAGGSISPSSVQMIDRGGESTIFIITANSGYTIADVIIDGTNHLGAIRTYKFDDVTENHTISAIFKN